ncbi:MAG TPA: hypothetical protein VFB08_20755 [Burkholderiales bacterium]|nr:hypothetical protein [Burkholderiales bacterium]
MKPAGADVESLARPEVRARLPLWQLVRLYLDPFALFKNASAGTPGAQAEALDYNRRHRRILLAYAWRWLVIGGGCLGGMSLLAALARAEPVLIVPIVGLEIGFSAAVCALLLSLAVYVLLGLHEA